VQWIVRAAEDRGFAAVVFNARGCGGQELKTPRAFCATFTEDVRTAVRYLRHVVGAEGRLFAVG